MAVRARVRLMVVVILMIVAAASIVSIVTIGGKPRSTSVRRRRRRTECGVACSQAPAPMQEIPQDAPTESQIHDEGAGVPEMAVKDLQKYAQNRRFGIEHGLLQGYVQKDKQERGEPEIVQ